MGDFQVIFQQKKSLIASIGAHILLFAGLAFFASSPEYFLSENKPKNELLNVIMIDFNSASLQENQSKIEQNQTKRVKMDLEKSENFLEKASLPKKEIKAVNNKNTHLNSNLLQKKKVEITEKKQNEKIVQKIKKTEKQTLLKNSENEKDNQEIAKNVVEKQNNGIQKPIFSAKNSTLNSIENKNAEVQVKTNQNQLLANNHSKKAQNKINSNQNSTQNLEKPKLLVRALPVYPKRAQDLGLEGLVKVIYDINENGKIENIRILEAKPKNVFEKEVRKTLQKWQYESKKSNNLRATIVFKLNGASIEFS